MATSTTAINTTPAIAATSAPTAQLSNTSNADFDRFLKLLTAQMKYQDPMDPTDPTQFVAQLAQFSQVEQQTKTNALLQGIADALAGNGKLSENAALLGKSVKTEASTLTVPEGGGSVPITVDVSATGLKNLRLEVLDARSDVLRRINLNAGTTDLSFDGKDGNGNPLAAGQYTVRVVGEDDANKRTTAGTVTVAGKVTEVRRDSSGGYNLVLDTGAVVSAADVTRLGS
ncbi:flagellar biosynthesis protein FlgD [Pseudoroseomonas deserti]|uniref:Basal-body rod modification protein FlgD n=1 Tax=Teichococcus deserti TaxID=1817963 RepID=A0A1V2GWY2_9PROT|nr:flagellar hook capping FlgD N-terminal domain-containing protein [Pseudoroseomonas deserti]ONG48090.1 flagellar biosynthesis protein FlgD [Pseudoroseomonas deserti]